MTTKKRQRRNYPEDFKRDAVALVTEQGYTRAEAARSLGVGAHLIGRWIKDFEVRAGGEALSEGERDELKRLRRENRELRMEKDILKKASLYSTDRRNSLL